MPQRGRDSRHLVTFVGAQRPPLPRLGLGLRLRLGSVSGQRFESRFGLGLGLGYQVAGS